MKSLDGRSVENAIHGVYGDETSYKRAIAEIERAFSDNL